jgi:MoaA/NifB/PqqE/SkfB family radical SAM enzyme
MLFSDVIPKIRKNGLTWAAQRFVQKIQKSSDQLEQNRRFRHVNTMKPSGLAELFTTPSNKPLKIQSIHLEHTTYCNLRCPGCHLTSQVAAGKWKYQHMKIDNYKSILHNLPAANVLALFSFGEPTMHPDFPELLDLARNIGKFDSIVTTSNITIRDGAYYDGLFDFGLDHLTVSVDSLDPIIADELRTRTKIEKLKSNLSYLISRHASQMHIATVVSKKNLHDLKNTYKLIDQMAKMSDSKVFISLMKFDDGQLEGTSDIVLTSDDHQLLQDFTEQWKDEFSNLIFGPVPVEKEKMPTLPTICVNTWENIKVSVNGYIYTCTYRHEPFIPSEFCDLKKHSYEKIMTSQTQLDYLSDYLKTAPDFCDGCTSNCPR